MSALTPDETILGLLVVQPQHGYQLLEAFHDQDRLGQVWSLSTSQLYAVLKRLERRAWIVGHQIDSENAPPRTEYATTQAGLEQLMIWLNEPHPSPSIRRVRVEFLSRLYIILHAFWDSPLIPSLSGSGRPARKNASDSPRVMKTDPTALVGLPLNWLFLSLKRSCSGLTDLRWF
jgi:DNA-binding PadR family transcriptional regulator